MMASGCRRSWPGPGSGPGGPARSSSTTGGSRSTARSPTLGRRVDPEHDHVTVDGVTRPRPARPRLLPPEQAGQGRHHRPRPARAARTVIDLVPAEPRVFPVGRLDWDTEGLLLLTNDGDLAHGLTHPSRGVPKTYLAEVSGVPDKAALRAPPGRRRPRRRPHRPRPGPSRPVDARPARRSRS